MTNMFVVFCIYLLLVIICYTYQEELKIKENKTYAFRTIKEIEENLMYNEFKHTNSRNYFDEVKFIIIYHFY